MKAFLTALDRVNRCRDEPELLDLLAWRMSTWRRQLDPREFNILATHCQEKAKAFRDIEAAFDKLPGGVSTR